MINEQIPGFCPVPQLAVLQYLAANIPENGIVVEVGCLFGRSAFTWATSSPPDARIFCVDVWDGSQFPAYSGFSSKRGQNLGQRKNTIEEFKKNVNLCHEKITCLQEKSPLSEWKSGPIDIIYLDADHSDEGFRNDLEFWSMHLKRDGILCGDDFSSEFPSLVEQVNNYASSNNLKVIILGKLWILESSLNREKIQESAFIFRKAWKARLDLEQA